MEGSWSVPHVWAYSPVHPSKIPPGTTSTIRMEPGQLHNLTHLQSLLDDFPQEFIRHAFAYGSGVFSQQDDSSTPKDAATKNVVDLILVVSDALQFHTEQKKRHPSLYGYYSAEFATRLQRQGPKLYFVLQDNNVKYGVVQCDDLLEDLQHWDHLYVAGRMHKPIVNLRTDETVERIQNTCNLPFALATALTLTSLKDNTAIADATIFTNIAALSYAGDPRMGWAEAPDKIRSLVHGPGQLERFRKLYEPAMRSLEKKGLLSVNDRAMEWDVQGIRRHCLPKILQNVPEHAIRSKLQSIVGSAARYQSIKGLFTVGPKRALQYGLRKFSKGILRRGGSS